MAWQLEVFDRSSGEFTDRHPLSISDTEVEKALGSALGYGDLFDVPVDVLERLGAEHAIPIDLERTEYLLGRC